MKNILLFILSLIFVSCEKQINWELKAKPNNFIVVDGIITDERKAQKVKLSFPVDQLNKEPMPVSGAIVLLSNEDFVYPLIENPAGSGFYKADSTFMALINKHYTLQIYYQNKFYSAKTGIISGISFSPLIYSKNSTDEMYHIDWVTNSFNTNNFAIFEVLLDWSLLPQYQNINPDSCKAKLYYYSLPTLDVSEVIAPGKQKVSFPLGTIITERRYSLTPEHAAYFRALLLETNWQGGLFDSERANLPTNLSAGAIGFFGACSVTSLSLTVTE